jgi:predicted ATP-binding protein involved in virulence
MRIKKIAVKNLFGIFNHEIPLNTEARITIIHSPNGYGKTMMLSMLNALSHSEYYQFSSIPFDEFWIEFDGSKKLLIEKITAVNKKSNRIGANIKLFESKGSKPKIFPLEEYKELLEGRIPLSIFERYFDELRRVGSRRWVHIPSKKVLSLSEVVERFGHLLPARYRVENKGDKPPWLPALEDEINVEFIETQRLLNFTYGSSEYNNSAYHLGEDVSPSPAILTYSEELQEAIHDKLAEYGTLSQKLDRSFPSRLVKSKKSNGVSPDELKIALNYLEDKRARLVSAGFLEKDTVTNFSEFKQIDKSNINVLSIYVNDVKQKLQVFDELTDKIDLLIKIVNSRFLHKKLSISKDEGFVFTSLEGKIIPPEKLSSGEQHELVLFYKLLFRLKPGTLVLIDEPEISLHVVWQQLFLNDLQKITNLVKFDVLITTHSPQIINDRWDLTVELKGPEDCEKN